MNEAAMLDVGCLANVDTRVQPYLWQRRIPTRRIGKQLFVHDLIARVT